MKLLQTDTLQGAREKLLLHLKKREQDIEYSELLESEGRVLAADIKSSCNIPAFRRSTVDGYAVVARDTQGASESIPVFLNITNEVRIGYEAEFNIISGQCAYVPTGGMVPDGADAVVMVEYCEQLDEISLAVNDSVSVGRNLVAIGEDIRSGELVLKKGTMLRPQEIGALASLGIAVVPVYKKMRLTLISTGDELVALGDEPQLGQIRDINTYALKSLAIKHGFEVVGAHVLNDDEDLLKSVISNSMISSDIIAVSGGSSKGKKDMTAKVLDELSKPGVFIHGISIKPGKPTILGYDEESDTVLLGLPGHPVAALLIFELIAIWLKNSLEWRPEKKAIFAKMDINIASDPGKTTIQTVKLSENENGYIASPVFGKSGLMSTLTLADGYTIIEMNKEGLQKGEQVKVFLL